MYFFRLNRLLRNTIEAISESSNVERETTYRLLLTTLLQLIGEKFIQEDIYHDGLSIKASYKDTDFLSSLDSKSYLDDRKQLILGFINGSCSIKYKDQIQKLTLFAISVAVEMIYFIRCKVLYPVPKQYQH